MRVKCWSGVVAGAMLVAVAAPVVAHHSFAAEFDINRPIQLDGVVTKMQFSNPHSWLHIEVTTDDRREAAVDGRGRRAERADSPRLESQLGAGRHQGARRGLPGEGSIVPRERPRDHVAGRLELVHGSGRGRGAERRVASDRAERKGAAASGRGAFYLPGGNASSRKSRTSSRTRSA